MLSAEKRQPIDQEELLLRCAGQPTIVRRVLEKFRQTLCQDMANLSDAWSDANRVVLAELAHRIKGAAGNMSAHGLCNAATAFEASILRGDDASKQWQQLLLEAERLEIFLGALD